MSYYLITFCAWFGLLGCATNNSATPFDGYTVRHGKWIDIYKANGMATGAACEELISERELNAHCRKLTRENHKKGFYGPEAKIW